MSTMMTSSLVRVLAQPRLGQVGWQELDELAVRGPSRGGPFFVGIRLMAQPLGAHSSGNASMPDG
jgi:hypothetical protein